MSTTLYNSPLLLITLIAAYIAPAFLVTSYVIDRNALTDVVKSPALASKVIFQSPSVENIFKDFIVSSKPLSLSKYSTRPKTKKTKKDSRIYYIPIPPLPYRYIPGVGYDYQPMKIKPLLVEPTTMEIPVTTEYFGYPGYRKPQNPYNNYQQQLQNSYYQSMASQEVTTEAPVTKKPTPPTEAVAESKVYRLERNDYYFNGRPFRLQVAHAGPKYNLTPQNLKSSFYFNKNIIY